MEDVAIVVLVEEAGTGCFVSRKLRHPVVVIHLTLLHFVGRERNVEIPIEIRLEGGDPLEGPAHALLVGIDIRQRRVGNTDHGDVPVRKMNNEPVVTIHPE